MDALLSRLGVQAVNYAIRSGIALTSTYAVQQCSRLLKTVSDKAVHAELKELQHLLSSKIKIISPAIDLVEFKSGRGNIFLASAVPLAKSLHREIVSLGRRLEHAAKSEETWRLGGSSASAEQHRAALTHIIADIKRLLARIDRDIPLLQLAITASGESLSTTLPLGISPSRLLQASTFLIVGDTQFASNPSRPVQIGPSFTLSLYMLFVGHSAGPGVANAADISGTSPDRSRGEERRLSEEPYGLGDGERKPTWQEVIHKARVRLCRTPLQWCFDPREGYRPQSLSSLGVNGQNEPNCSHPSGRPDEYAYHLEIIEDLDDGRMHDEESGKVPSSFESVSRAGLRESIPIHQVAKIFYTDTGRILNIGNEPEGDNSPVLLLKRDVSGPTPTQLRKEWDTGSIDSVDDDLDQDAASDACSDHKQAELDRQLHEESQSHCDKAQALSEQQADLKPNLGWHFPRHLDSEWIAFEVFTDDDDDASSTTSTNSNQDLNSDAEDATSPLAISKPRRAAAPDRSSLDAQLLQQIRRISLRSPSPPRPASQDSSSQAHQHLQPADDAGFVSRSPFGAIATSLSLLEMLVRLTSLQAFRQASHLAIPDHVLTFFLEETATTGLRGKERWDAREEARRRVGFDPYLDTPTK